MSAATKNLTEILFVVWTSTRNRNSNILVACWSVDARPRIIRLNIFLKLKKMISFFSKLIAGILQVRLKFFILFVDIYLTLFIRNEKFENLQRGKFCVGFEISRAR